MKTRMRAQCRSKIRHPMQTLQSFLRFYNERNLLDGSHCSTVMIISGAESPFGDNDDKEDDDDGEIENLDALQQDMNMH